MKKLLGDNPLATVFLLFIIAFLVLFCYAAYLKQRDIVDFDGLPMTTHLLGDCSSHIRDAKGVALETDSATLRIDFVAGNEFRSCMGIRPGMNSFAIKGGGRVLIFDDGSGRFKLLKGSLLPSAGFESFVARYGDGVDWLAAPSETRPIPGGNPMRTDR